MSNAESMTRVILEIKRIIGEYLEQTAAGVHESKAAIELILMEIDRSDAIGMAERELSKCTGPRLVK
jgi:hypothetical protein